MKQILLMIAVVIGQSVLAADKARSFLITGTGFFITEGGYLLTNNHVVDGASRITIKINGKELPAKVVKSDKLSDLAVLKVAGKFSALPIVSSRNVGLGDEVFTIGFPQIAIQGVSHKLTKGSINGLTGIKDDPSWFQISVPIQPGNSGGPLVDEYGNVVGIVVARLDALKLLKETGRIPQNVNYAVKGALAMAFLKALPTVASKIKDPIPRTKPRKFSDVVKEVQAATVLILVRGNSPDTATLLWNPPNTAQPTGPISVNTLLRQFRSRGIKVWLKSGRTTTRTDTILVVQGNYVYALLHTSDTPFPIGPKAMGISHVEPTLSTPEAGKPKPMVYNLPFAQFLKDDPRVLASPLMSVSQAADRGIRPYQIAAQPYQFPKAFVISRDGKSYGEVEFKLNRAHKGYVKIDTRFAATSFIPSKGDIVLSQKGELLGMMVNSTYCYVIRDLKSESSIAFRKDLNRATIAKTLKEHYATIQRKAVQLRTDKDTPKPAGYKTEWSTGGGMSAERMKERMMASFEKLELTEAQQAIVDAIIEKQLAETMALFGSGSRAAMREKFGALREKYTAQFKEVLTEEQFEAYEKARSKQRGDG
jgi:hypothetical protein